MKKFLSVILMCAVFFAMTSCGNTVKETYKVSTDGLEMKMTFEAKEDTVTEITQITTISTEGYGESELDALQDSSKESEKQFDGISGVTYKGEVKDESFVETVVIKGDKDTFAELSEKALFPMVEGKEKLSLEEIESELTALGWEKEK